YALYVSFFFSSRRRHTRFSRDWSSDVCSSDLGSWENTPRSVFDALKRGFQEAQNRLAGLTSLDEDNIKPALREVRPSLLEADVRSEERRVGKEGRCGWSTDDDSGKSACGMRWW